MTELDLFLEVLDREPAERAAYLDGACGGDDALRRRIEALLRSYTGAGGFLAVPVAEQLAAADPAAANAAPDLSFLAPPSKPGSLGRLDHYEVLGVVGKGGMGIVLRARDTKLERVVAIKVLAAPLAASGAARQRFAREARATAAIRDEHVVAIHAVCDDVPVPYLVTEFIDGCNLDALLRRGGPLEVKEILRIGIQVARGLAAAHKHGLVHRDVKPGNILLENGVQRVKLTDFGLARAADDPSLTELGLIAGTPLYMAPEQAAGETVDARADLFSLGSVLYELCTGRPAFRAPSTLAVIRRVCDETPRPIWEANPDVPESLCRLIERLHAKKPADRPASAKEVADLLAGLLADLQQPGSGAPAANAPADLERRKRAPRRWLWAAAALLLLFAGLALGETTGVIDVRGTVIRLFSPEGTLVVEVDDPGVSVAVDGADLVITGAGVKEIRLKPGNYEVEASKDGKLVRRELVTVARNGRQVVRISAEAGAHVANVPDPAAGFQSAPQDAWEKSVAALPAAEQVKAVARWLKARNPTFNGNVTPTIEDGVVTGLVFLSDDVADISPVRALVGLKSLDCAGSAPLDGKSKVSDLAPLRGMKLTKLRLDFTPVADLSDLRGMPLKDLQVNRTRVTDLSPLRGMPLRQLEFGYTTVADLTPLQGMKLDKLSFPYARVTDLSPLRGMPLRRLRLGGTGVADLSPLKGMQLNRLYIYETPVADLSPLRGIPLERLHMEGAPVTDLSPLKGMPLTDLTIDFRAERDTKILRSLTTLQNINYKPAADFWKESDAK
jgi:hypothetical protein